MSGPPRMRLSMAGSADVIAKHQDNLDCIGPMVKRIAQGPVWNRPDVSHISGQQSDRTVGRPGGCTLRPPPLCAWGRRPVGGRRIAAVGAAHYADHRGAYSLRGLRHGLSGNIGYVTLSAKEGRSSA